MKEFKGSLGQYKVVKTEDESETIWSEFFDENCHNISGAKDETIYNYINGCEILNKSKKFNPLNVFDVGFGLGMGLTLLLETLTDKNTPAVNYYSIELDELFLEWTLNEKFKQIIFNTIELNGIKYKEAQFKNFKIVILIGDARQTVPVAQKGGLFFPLHAIFQDPFSPKKNKALWTVEWFEVLKHLSHPEVILSTYSSSISIRKALICAGFRIENGPGFGKKKTKTRAFLYGEMTEVLKKELECSPILELRDN